MSLATRRAVFDDASNITSEPTFGLRAENAQLRRRRVAAGQDRIRFPQLSWGETLRSAERTRSWGGTANEPARAKSSTLSIHAAATADSPAQAAPEPQPFTPPQPVQSPSGAWGFAPDPRFPEEVAEFTTDFGPCPCGQGQMLQSDNGEVHHEDGYVGYIISCSDTEDLLGGVDYDIEADTSDLAGGRAQWYERCSQERATAG